MDLATEIILPKFPNKDQRDCIGVSPVHLAAARGDFSLVQKFFTALPNHPISRDNEGCCPLFYSTFFGHYDCSKYLLSLGCSIDSKDKNGNIPLFYAAAGGHVELFEELIRLKLKHKITSFPVIVNKQGRTLFHFVCSGERDEEAVKLAQTFLKCTSQDGQSFAHFQLLDNHSNSVLHYAAFNNLQYTFFFFQKYGKLDVNLQNEQGMTPLHILSSQGNKSFLAEILKRFPLIERRKRTNKGRTLLHLACHSGSLPTVKMLLNAA